MKLSVIVPVYNMASDNKLTFCMDSLVGQTLPASDYEILAVDDASTDSSLEILREYEQKYPDKVKVIHYEKNRRQGGAKNEGLKQAKGDWIGFVDSDDWVTPDYYERLLKKAEETGADLVGCDYNLVTEHTFEVGKIVQNNTAEQTGILDKEKRRKLILRPGSMVIKIYCHSVIKENQLAFPEDIFYEDNCAGPVWSCYFTHFEKVEEPMYYYYQHQVSTVHHITQEKCEDRMKAAQLLYEECGQRGFLAEYREEIEYRFVELYYVNTLFSYMAGVKHPQGSFVKKMRAGVLEKFPEFQKNSYYRALTGAEEQKMISLLQKSVFVFFWYYKLKHWAWRLKKGWARYK